MNQAAAILLTAPSAQAADPFIAGCQERLDDIWRYVRTCTGSVHDAEDLTHDVFVRACAMRHQFTGGELGAWLYQIARNRVALYYRSKGIERRALQALESRAAKNAAGANDAGATGAALETPELLQAALLELSETEREALRLKFCQSFSHAEIARLLEIDELYLGVVVFRALKRLRRRLGSVLEGKLP